ncbi:MAG: PorT family protein, partial [Fibrobacter sp.]|nr:PorT family protein [Fibrobacter sp.]
MQNRPFIDERRFHYGFFVGLHDQGLSLSNNGYIDPATGQQWMAENDSQNMGLSIGILGEWKLTNHLALRLTPSLHFGSKHIRFLDLSTGRRDAQDMKSTYIGFPAALKVSAPRFNNFRPYVVGGVQPVYDLTPGKGAKLRTKPLNLNLEVGMGCDFYLPFFKLIPELKFSMGLANLIDRKRGDLTDNSQRLFTEGIDRARSNMFIL